MVEAGIYTTNTLVEYKAGANASAVSKAEAYTNEYIAQAEAYINVLTEKIWATSTATFAALDAQISKLLSEAASNLAAIYVIQYDMSGFTTRIEAEDMINVLFARFIQCIELLRSISARDFMGA
jgi:hypothetical protein